MATRFFGDIMKCIYCLKNLTVGSFKGREHVIPQAFGKFHPENLVLHKMVCDECNTYLGKNVDRFLARDTLEGVERYRHGCKPGRIPHERSRVKSQVATGEFEGAHVIEMPPDDEHAEDIGLSFYLQVGFYNTHLDKWRFFKVDEIPDKDELVKNGYSVEKYKYIGNDDELEYLFSVLHEKGYPVSDIGEKNRFGGKMVVEMEITIDRLIARAIGKICFNYLAWKTDLDFVLNSSFDPIRTFIRNDIGNHISFFNIRTKPILYEDCLYNTRQTCGHLLTLGWMKDSRSIISYFSPFNLNTYSVKLCKNFDGIWRPLKCGHHFDVENGIVSEMAGISSSIII
jgi:hypothetical protein